MDWSAAEGIDPRMKNPPSSSLLVHPLELLNDTLDIAANPALDVNSV
jgi:hypothetical protein